jgi:8-amino-7-oxononanoate synthase
MPKFGRRVANPYGWLPEAATALRRAGWQRTVQETSGRVGPVITLEGRTVLNFGSNNYLGLAGDERLIASAVAALRTYGTGSTGSRLLSGHLAIHRELEAALARWKGTEDALVFSSGYLANLGTISALVGSRDGIFEDSFNHSSLKSGALLSQATRLEYAHGSMPHLEALLQQHRHRFRRALILTDSVFSMDGDLAPLPELQQLAQSYGCMVLVDEAHGTGVLGSTGAGGVEHFGLSTDDLIQVGTLSKALASLGGYVCGSALLIDYLRHRARTWVYSTGLSAADAASALKAIQLSQAEPQRRLDLWARVTQLKKYFQAEELFPSDSAILCWRVGSLEKTLQVAQAFQTAGIFAPAIRPPTVPTSRIRFSVMATHSAAMVSRLGAEITAQRTPESAMLLPSQELL